MWDNFCFYNSSDYFHSPRWALEIILKFAKICHQHIPNLYICQYSVAEGQKPFPVDTKQLLGSWYPSLIKISIYDVDFLLFSKNFAQFCQDIFSSCYSTRHIIFLPLYDNFWFLLTKIVRAWNTFSTAIFPPILHIHSVEQMTIAVSNFSFIMSLMTFFLTMKVEALQNPIINLEKEGRDKNLSAGYGALFVHLFHRKYWP